MRCIGQNSQTRRVLSPRDDGRSSAAAIAETENGYLSIDIIVAVEIRQSLDTRVVIQDVLDPFVLLLVRH